ncbi:YraN family protein, partial [Paenibacillus sepulcri]|nr:YraN family protein [Paenibacillus sepulcri]
GAELVFVEVRTRKSGGRFGTAAESVDARKQRQVRTIAEVYMQATGTHGMPVRFDVIAVMVDRGSGSVVELNHIEAAF